MQYARLVALIAYGEGWQFSEDVCILVENLTALTELSYRVLWYWAVANAHAVGFFAQIRLTGIASLL